MLAAVQIGNIRQNEHRMLTPNQIEKIRQTEFEKVVNRRLASVFIKGFWWGLVIGLILGFFSGQCFGSSTPIEPIPFQVDYCDNDVGWITGVRSYFFHLFWNIEPILLEE